jgi:3-oxoacyl-[acyl-carrier-protein] synthase II
MQYALVAAEEAIKDSNWINLNESQKMATGVCIGSGIGSIQDVADSIDTLNEKGERKISPYFIPRLLLNLAAGHVSMKHGFGGPNHCVSTACTTGAHSIGDAARFIEYGDADVMVAGGSEASINPLAIAGFSSLRALSTNYNEDPQKASRPFDKDRDGFVMGEGAGVVVLEEYEHAKKRGAKIYCELGGYGLSGDAYHITSPPLDGNGAIRAMKRAIELGQVSAKEVDYVNAHATSTPLGDKIEMHSIKTVCGDQVAVSSTKGSIGHLLGASGAVEAIFTILAVSTVTKHLI